MIANDSVSNELQVQCFMDRLEEYMTVSWVRNEDFSETSWVRCQVVIPEIVISTILIFF